MIIMLLFELIKNEKKCLRCFRLYPEKNFIEIVPHFFAATSIISIIFYLFITISDKNLRIITKEYFFLRKRHFYGIQIVTIEI